MSSSVNSKGNSELTVSPPPITMGQMTQTQDDDPTQTQHPVTFPTVVSPPLRSNKQGRRTTTSPAASDDSDLQYVGTKAPPAVLSRRKTSPPPGVDLDLLYVGSHHPTSQAPLSRTTRPVSTSRTNSTPERTTSGPSVTTSRSMMASSARTRAQRPAGTVSDRKKKVARKNNVSYDDNGNCFFCHAPVCHEELYGPYCTHEGRVYLSGQTTRNNIDEQGLFEIYQSTYSSAMKWDMYRAFGNVVERRGLPALPCCMLNGSFKTCVNMYRSDMFGYE
jgi:hypothetical protein